MTDTKLDPAVQLEFEQFRPELTAYCYRMLGSAFEAEDAVQETMVRAWRGYEKFEGRSAVRSWLYKIATNVCYDSLKGRQKRALPMDCMPLGSASAPVADRMPDYPWLEPIPDSRVVPVDADPAEAAVARETVRLAFVAALQHLPPKQRAVLILREVLRWKAEEVAELLETTTASVNSALQRARATLADSNLSSLDASTHVDAEKQELLARYVDAFERFDIQALVDLLHEDATMSMPPFPLWLRGASEMHVWLTGPGAGCRGSRYEPIDINGSRGFAQWRSDGNGGYDAWALHVIDVQDGKIASVNFFVEPRFFPLFGLPVRIEPEDAREAG